MADLKKSFLDYMSELRIPAKAPAHVRSDIQGVIEVTRKRPPFLNNEENRDKINEILAAMFMVFLPELRTEINRQLTKTFLNNIQPKPKQELPTRPPR